MDCMNCLSRLLALGMALVSLSLMSCENDDSSGGGPDANVAGTWQLELREGSVSGNGALVLSQSGATISGYTLPSRHGVSGTVDGNDVSVGWVAVSGQSGCVVNSHMTLNGSISGGSMSGSALEVRSVQCPAVPAPVVATHSYSWVAQRQ